MILSKSKNNMMHLTFNSYVITKEKEFIPWDISKNTAGNRAKLKYFRKE